VEAAKGKKIAGLSGFPKWRSSYRVLLGALAVLERRGGKEGNE
jgi:hypothetical protein